MRGASHRAEVDSGGEMTSEERRAAGAPLPPSRDTIGFRPINSITVRWDVATRVATARRAMASIDANVAPPGATGAGRSEACRSGRRQAVWSPPRPFGLSLGQALGQALSGPRARPGVGPAHRGVVEGTPNRGPPPLPAQRTPCQRRRYGLNPNIIPTIPSQGVPPAPGRASERTERPLSWAEIWHRTGQAGTCREGPERTLDPEAEGSIPSPPAESPLIYKGFWDPSVFGHSAQTPFANPC